MMNADIFSDRRMFSTDNNEYAYGLNDENEWEENIRDDEVSLDDEMSDYFDSRGSGSSGSSRGDESDLYNETGYDSSRLN
jgi:hypothetical protein